MVVNAMQEITALLPSMNYLSDSVSQLFWQLPVDLTVVAQQISDPDILGKMQKAFNQFVQTGQIWALLIGLVLGWMLRNLTSYG